MSTVRAQEQGEAFVTRLDAAVPGLVTGVYLVGSAALGDWQAKVSNIDVVVVADGPWSAPALAAAARHHSVLEVGDEAPRVSYTTFADLAGPVTGEGAGASFEGGRQVDAAEMDNPMTRSVLGTDAVALRGSEWLALGGGGADALRTWAADRLGARWRRWAGARRAPGQLWRRKPLAEDLLEVTRLHVAASQGRLVSKVRSGPLALEAVSSRFDRVVADAVGYRQGSRTSMYWGPAERKAHSLELIEALVDLAVPQRS